MPHYVYREDSEDGANFPNSYAVRYHDAPVSPSYPTRAEAHRIALSLTASTGQKHLVAFQADATENIWRAREQARFDDGTYCPVPWAGQSFMREETDQTSNLRTIHYAHLSLRYPGLVAYTASEEHGVADRQTRTSPGRYLNKYCANLLSEASIAAYVAQVKALSGSVLKIATSADEIEQVYLHGPTSCMSHQAEEYETNGLHPVRVYGGSDLACAYLGNVDIKVAARSIVWPAKQVYTRIYGDATLRHVLEIAGYREASNLNGATVRMLCVDEGAWAMPYIDAADYAAPDHVRKMFTLTNQNQNGCYSAKETNGRIGEPAEPENTCSHCGESCDEDDTYCQCCNDGRHNCEHCGEDCWNEAGYETVNGSWICESCADRSRFRCAHNGAHTWYPNRRPSAQDLRDRVPELCDACENGGIIFCDENHTYDGIDYDACPDCEADTTSAAVPVVEAVTPSDTPTTDPMIGTPHSHGVARDDNRGSWRCADAFGVCYNRSCNAPIGLGQLFWQWNAGFGWCIRCAERYRSAPWPSWHIAPMPDVIPEATIQALADRGITCAI